MAAADRTATRRPRAARARSARLAPGITMLEVVLAMVLLGLVTASVTGTLGTIESLSARDRQKLAGYELANRLMLMYLDDDQNMPGKNLPLEYGPWLYFYDVDLVTAKMEINSEQRRSGSQPMKTDRYERITVTVFLADESGDYPVPDQQIAILSRIRDPFSPRNYDSADRYWGKEENLQRLIHGLVGGVPGDLKAPQGEGKPR